MPAEVSRYIWYLSGKCFMQILFALWKIATFVQTGCQDLESTTFLACKTV